MHAKSSIRLAILALFVSLFSPVLRAQARGPYETILEFHSDITLQEDASLLVSETITVFSTGNHIRHGIYRDFPTDYRDLYFNHYVVGFQMLSATRDSNNETFRVEDIDHGKRIYLGDAGTLISAGPHTYRIVYSTNRQLGFFPDHDELFWNVTGLGWGFPIEHASATVHLPPNIPAAEVHISGYTGVKGSRAADLTAIAEGDAFLFSSTRLFYPHEGLTVVLTWPKGYFAEPTFLQRLDTFFRDNRSALLLLAGFTIMLLYYLIAWSAVGRDPAPGIVMPIYQPPAGLSPAGMRYLVRMSFDNKTFAAAILDMAARGFLTIVDNDNSYQLKLTGKDDRVLSDDEKQVARVLFDGRPSILLHNMNHTIIAAALKALSKWLQTAEDKVFFVTNSRFLTFPIALSFVVIGAYLLSLGTARLALGLFMSVWLSFWSLGVAGLLYGVSKAWQTVRHSGKLRISEMGGAIFLSLFCIPFIFFECMGLVFLVKSTSLALAIFLLCTAALHILFVYLLKAPTQAGRQLLDQVEGFKTFLGAVDADRLNRAAPPDQTPQTFEKFLPYALALDLEQQWAEKFSLALAAVGAPPEDGTSPGYVPSYYSGTASHNFSGGNFASSLGDSLSSAISSSASAPGSSGGGGGGSGGGGGGGGGGGW
jgi:uncharacterized membrane protein YgcG